MSFPVPGSSRFDLVLPDEAATRRLAHEIAYMLLPNDLVTLSGDLGAGKTAFARAVLRSLSGNELLEVPSPTYTFLQIYDLPKFSVVHADLYRISSPDELAHIGWEEAQDGAVVLVEWPQRAEQLLTADRLDVCLTLAHDLGPHFRRVRLTGTGHWAVRLSRLMHLRAFLITSGWDSAQRRAVDGDASGRRYERLCMGSQKALLMDAPKRPDGPPIRDGKPYSQIAHLAEDVQAFVAVTQGLRAVGLSAPQIYSADLTQGFLLVEDLGHEFLFQDIDRTPLADRYGVAVDVLVDLHSHQLPCVVPLPNGARYSLPSYDLGALLIEVELLVDWYLPHMHEAALTEEQRSYFVALWSHALTCVAGHQDTWVLRDYHSPNLLWLEGRTGVKRVGLIDYQDAVLGHPAYDLVSLLQDARIHVPEDLELMLLSRYAKGRNSQGAFDLSSFAACYALLGAQRASKVLGIFARLKHRDGKAHYLSHMPRVWSYLQRCLAHPQLAPLKSWYDAYVPVPGLPKPSANGSVTHAA